MYNIINTFSDSDYYSYGSLMGGKQYNSTGYRYGFNGKEKDNEISGSGNQYDYGFRIYNPRIGKFLSVDPLTQSYPELTPYQFASNTPLMAIDLDGLEAQEATLVREATTTTLRVVSKNGVEQGGKVIALRATAQVVESPCVLGTLFKGVSTFLSTAAFVFVTTPAYGPNPNSTQLPLPVGSFPQGNVSTFPVNLVTPKPNIPDNERNNKTSFKFVTYSLYNAEEDKYYIGRTSGRGTPQELVEKRFKNHHMAEKGYETPVALTSFSSKINGDFNTRKRDPA